MLVGTECPMCGKQSVLLVDPVGFQKWQEGELIQRAFPDMPIAEREMLISGTCGPCWDEMWKNA